MCLKSASPLLDGGVGALAVASGQSAITLAFLNIAQAGDEIVSADNLYGGTYNLFHYTFPRLGINVNFVKSNDLAAFQKAITPKTKAIYAESIGNPKLDVADLEGISTVAHKNGIPLVLDNTVSPYLLRPIDFGVDIVVYSATKFIGGHGTSHRRPDRRFGQIRLDKRQIPADCRSGSELSRHQFCRGAEAARQYRLYHQSAGYAACAISGRHFRRSMRFCSCRGWKRCICRCRGIRKMRWRLRSILQKHPKVSWVNYPGP